MTEDFLEDGRNVGRGQAWRNNGHDSPHTDSDVYSYNRGIIEGEHQLRVRREVDRELYGEES